MGKNDDEQSSPKADDPSKLNAEEQSKFKALLLKQIADRQNLERMIGAIAGILITNVAKYIVSLDFVSRGFLTLFGVSPARYFYTNLRYFVIALLTAGYTVAFYFLYRKYIAPMPSRRRVVYGAAAVMVIGSLLTLNVYSLPLQVPSSVRIPTKAWSSRIVGSQADNGGIRVKAADQSFPTQVWTTAQALTALLADEKDLDDEKIARIRKAFDYIEKYRRPAPTKTGDYDEGWGLYEGHKKSTTEIAGWVTVAYIGSLESQTKIWNADQRDTIRERVKRDLALIVRRQNDDGGWRPIEDDAPKFTRTYSTAIALWTLAEARRSGFVREAIGNNYDTHIREGVNWLLKTYQVMPDRKDEPLGWVPNPNRSGQREAFDGLTAQVLFILSRIENQPDFAGIKQDPSLLKFKKAFIAKQDLAKRFVCSNDRIHDYDLSFTSDKGPAVDFVLEGSTLLWFPWSYAALTALSKDDALTAQEKLQAITLRQEILDSKVDDLNKFVDEEFMYVLAENLYCLSVSK